MPDTMRRPSYSVPNPDPTTLTTDQLRREISALGTLIDARLDEMDKVIVRLQTVVDKQPTPAVLDERRIALEQIVDEKYNEVKDYLVKNNNDIVKWRDEQENRIKIAVAQMAEVLLANLNNQIMLSEQRFDRTQTQFEERDERAKMQSSFDSAAVASALSAVRESTGVSYASNTISLTKMESSLTKQIDQLQILMTSIKQNVDEKVNDLKSRLDRGEGQKSVSDPATTDALRSLNTTMGSLATSRDVDSGGKSQTVFIISLVAAAVAILGLVFTVVNKDDASNSRARIEQRLNSIQK